MSLNIGDLIMSVVASDAGFQADLVKQGTTAGTKAGDVAGRSFSSRMSTVLKATIGGAVGGAIGVGLSLATKGGAELNAAVTAFAADTGATAEEAAQAQSTIGELFRTNLQGFDEIGGTLAKLRTDLGLTQAAADAAAQSYLDFSQVAGGTGAEAVSRFDDILDGFNLSAEAGPGIMDQLVASHQKYGGSINANAEALAGLAPALTAANLDYEDGIGLLNMFAASGVDAADAPAALTKALAKVKSPEELKQLIADITATEDPFERAQKASELFGAKAGPKLATALSKGGISDFMVSLDDAAGASTRAADTIQSGFGNQAQLVLKNFGGALAGIGTNFGPLILGFGSLLPILTPVITTAGTALGGFLAAAIPIGAAALPFLLVGALVAAVAFLIANPEIVGKIAAFAGDVIANIVNFLAGLPGALLGVFGSAFGAVVGAVPGFVLDVVGLILSIPFRILDLQVKMLEFFVGIGANILGAITGAVGSIVSGILGIPGAIVGGLVNGIGGVAAAAGDALLAPIRAASDVIDGIFDWITGKTNNAEQQFADLKKAAQAAADAAIFDAKAAQDAWMRLQGVPGYAVGTPFVPADMLAIVHKGEMIIPAVEAEAIRQGRSTIDRQAVQPPVAMGPVRVEHTISAEGAASLAAAGYDAKQVGRALAEGVDGLFSNLRSLQAMTPG